MKSYRILFIGNSHTYLHYMPQMLEQLAEAAGNQRKLQTVQITGEGAGLQWHWKNRAARNMLSDKSWDYVVLQERSGGPVEDPGAMQKYARLFDAEIKKHGARTIFYMTWANRRRPESQKIIRHAYARAARETGALLAPVGIAWENALKADPGPRLHHEDNRHASPTGAYLTACVFFTVICKADPAGLPGTLYLNDRCLVDLGKDEAGFLQKIAFDVV
ncbi:MAG: hypothetical protein JRE58_11740 [Deltaproteobacteria bacterium]|nr:hypothetical protein [Deltaproteobacteria bacterium]